MTVDSLSIRSTGEIVEGSMDFDSRGVTVHMDKSRLRVRWHANQASEASIQTAQDVLSKFPANHPVSLEFHTDRWQMSEDFSDSAEGSGRFNEIVRNFRSNLVSLSDYKAMPVMSMDDHSMTNIGHIFKAWDRDNGYINGHFFEMAELARLVDRLIIMKLCDDGGLYYSYIGLGHGKRFGADWPIKAIGTRYDKDQPDTPYTAWINEHYRDALSCGPRRDVLDTVIRCADAPPTRVQYDRVLLPCKFEDGTPALVSVSEVKPGLAPLFP